MSIAKFHHVSEARYQADSAAWTDVLPLAQLPLPSRATAGAAGYDFICPVTCSLQPGETALIPTGIRAEMEAGWVLLLFPRSSLGFKHQLVLCNTVGVIDSDYFHAKNEGHIMAKIVNRGDHPVALAQGERFFQGIFVPYGLAEEADVTTQREGGFGSTGR